MAIECAFGQLKRRFPLLSFGLRFKRIKDSANLIIAAVWLFNFCKKNGDIDFDNLNEEPIEENFINDMKEIEGAEKRDMIKNSLSR